jgi:exopolysaccharide biosynthesis predicted pyruvyltransferase EpsI
LRKGSFAQADKRGLRIVILPQSICDPREDIPSRTVVFVRERESLKHFPGSILAPDMAFALTSTITVPDRVKRKGVFLRSDHESLFGSPTGSDPINLAHCWQEYVMLAAENEQVITDRLHFAIAALLVRRKVVILPNSYHKNRSMWDTWLKDQGCEFETTVKA